MIDHPFQLLQSQLNSSTAGALKRLWIVDENISAKEIAAIQPTENLLALTNRQDVYQILQNNQFSAQLNDYDLSSLSTQGLDIIYYRVSKEKALVHYIINSAGRILKSGGQLCLAGYKKEGTKTYIDKSEDYLGQLVQRQRGAKSSVLACLQLTGKPGSVLDDKNYTQMSVVSEGDVDFSTKPGIFGWNKIDKGSAFLIEKLPDFLSGIEAPPQCVIDLGCGYGYLSVMAQRLLKTRFLATDNNVTAIAACQLNFERHGISGEVVLDDCAQGIQEQGDIVLCNPPFHQGFDVEGNLTDRFIDSSWRLLKPGGRALFVVNSFIPLERKAKAHFSAIEMLANNGSFKLIVLRR